MQKYFISKDDFKSFKITGDDVYHIKTVMRFKIGDEIVVSDEENEIVASISEIQNNYIGFKKVMAIQNNNELPFLTDLYQGYPKSDKLDDIVKHTTELGVSNIYGVITKRSIFKLQDGKIEGKIKRFNKIAKEASEQSNRKKLSHFIDIINLDKIDFSAYDTLIVCYEESAKQNEISNFKRLVKNIKPGSKVCILVGPEGGFDKSEIDDLIKKGFSPCGLGPRILRTETAALYVLSAMSYEMELK